MSVESDVPFFIVVNLHHKGLKHTTMSFLSNINLIYFGCTILIFIRFSVCNFENVS